MIRAPGAESPVQALVGPGRDAAAQRPVRRLRMERHVAQHDVGPRRQQPLVLGQQPGVGLHVVVEEQQRLALRGAHAEVAGGGRAAVGLGQDRQRDPRGQRLERLPRAVARAVDDHDDLERRAKILGLQRAHAGEHRLAALVGRHDDAEATSAGRRAGRHRGVGESTRTSQVRSSVVETRACATRWYESSIFQMRLVREFSRDMYWETINTPSGVSQRS